MSDPQLKVGRDKIQLWKENPVQFVRDCFGVEPDAWQADALMAFPHHEKIAFKACKGPGKTALLAWMMLNFLVTRRHAKIGATSISGDNLRDNLWSELAKWIKRSDLLAELLTWTATRVMMKASPQTWYATARNWPKTADPQKQADTLAGLHADYMMFVLDESGGIPQAVMATAEAVLASGVECKVVQAGNPTQLTGPLYRACVTDRKTWHVIEITGDPEDPKRSPRISMKWAQDQIDQYGRDNPWVKVNVLGQFPPASLNSLLGPEEVREAMARHLLITDYNWSQKRIGVDVARFGDDRSVFFPRQGLAAFRPTVMRHARDSTIAVNLATALMTAKKNWGSECELVDATGGWAAGMIDVLRSGGSSSIIEVQFAAPAIDARYHNRRAEIYFALADWVKAGGALPPIDELVPELVEPTYYFNPQGKFVLEDKALIKARIGQSPDLADALALTFGLPEMPAALPAGFEPPEQTVTTDFDPFGGTAET